jgi:hypothetical protein
MCIHYQPIKGLIGLNLPTNIQSFNLVLQHFISTRNEKTFDCTQCYLKNFVEKYKEMTHKINVVLEQKYAW